MLVAMMGSEGRIEKKKLPKKLLWGNFLFSPEANNQEKQNRQTERVSWPPPGGWVQRGEEKGREREGGEGREWERLEREEGGDSKV